MEFTTGEVTLKLTFDEKMEEAVHFDIIAYGCESRMTYGDARYVKKEEWVNFRNFIEKEKTGEKVLSFEVGGNDNAAFLSCTKKHIMFETLGHNVAYHYHGGVSANGYAKMKLDRKVFGKAFVEMLDFIIGNEKIWV